MTYNLRKMVISALMIALGIVLPFVLHSIPSSGSIFLPMHIPVLMCGLICGWPYGLIVGILTPVSSSLLTGMPPVAYLPSMICELATYGLVAGILSQFIHTKKVILDLYLSLIGAMIVGRIVYGILNSLVFSVGSYSLQMWMVASFVKALPGIIVQIIFIPAIIFALEKSNLIEKRY